MRKKIIKKLQELYNKIYESGYSHPFQKLQKTKPGITGEDPEEIESRRINSIVFNRNFSSKKVNRSSNRKNKKSE